MKRHLLTICIILLSFYTYAQNNVYGKKVVAIDSLVSDTIVARSQAYPFFKNGLGFYQNGYAYDEYGNKLFGFGGSSLADNYLLFANGTNEVVISSTGNDADVPISISPRGAGEVNFQSSDLEGIDRLYLSGDTTYLADTAVYFNNDGTGSNLVGIRYNPESGLRRLDYYSGSNHQFYDKAVLVGQYISSTNTWDWESKTFADIGSLFATDIDVSANLVVDGYTKLTSSTNSSSFYETGSFTPTVEDAFSNSATGSFDAYYTRIGNQVTIWVDLVNISTTGMTGSSILSCRNLPFAGIAGENANGTMQTAYVTYTSGADLSVKMVGNASYVEFYESISGSNRGRMIVSDLSSGTADIYFTLTYQTGDTDY